MIVLEEWKVLLAVVIALGAGVLIMFLYYRQTVPELTLISTCRRKGLPLGRIHWANGRETWEPLEKSKDGSMFFMKGKTRFGIDMTMYQKGRSSYMPGIEMVDYFTDSLLPLGPMDSNSIFQSIDIIRDPENKFTGLCQLPNRSIMTLVTKPMDKLKQDVRKYVHVERPDEATDEQYQELVDSASKVLLEEVKRAKAMLKELPVMNGIFTYDIAAESVNNQLTSKLGDDMETEIRADIVDDEAKKEKMWMYVIWSLVILVGGAIALYIIKMAIG